MFEGHTPDGKIVAIKLFKNHLSSQKELDIARDICDKGLKGIAALIDFGMLDDAAVARRFGVLENSIFIIYEHIESSLKGIWEDPRESFSMQDIV